MIYETEILRTKMIVWCIIFNIKYIVVQLCYYIGILNNRQVYNLRQKLYNDIEKARQYK